ALIASQLLLLLNTAAGGTAGSFELLSPNNNVTTIAASTVGFVHFRDSVALTVGTVNGTVGITTTGNDVTLCADTGDLTLDQQVNADTGTVRLQATAGQVTQSATGTITASILGVVAGSNILLDAA